MLPTSKIRGNSRSQSSLFSLAILVGAVCLSITDAVPGGLDGASGFLVGFAGAFIAFTIVRLAANNSIATTPLSKSEEQRISEIAAVTVSRLLTKGTGSAEWK